jgi:hypothetical protein
MPAPAASPDRNTAIAPPFASLAFPEAAQVSRPLAENQPTSAEKRTAWEQLTASSYVIIHVDGHDIGLHKRQPTATLPDGRAILIEWTPDNPAVRRWQTRAMCSPRPPAHITPELEELLRMAAQALGFREAFCLGGAIELIADEVRKLGPMMDPERAAWLTIYEGRSP